MSHIHIRFIFIAIALVTAFSLTAGIAFAQPPNVQKALDDTKESLDDLVTAKDEDSPFDVAYRIEAFKKVIELSLSEAKDLKIKLLAFDNVDNDDLLQWKDAMITALNEAIAYYEEQQMFISENEALMDLEIIRQTALQFEKWREEYYINICEQVQEFFFTQREQQALAIANRRWEKIERDLTRLERAGISGISKLRELLTQAGDLLLIGKEKNEEAVILFFDSYITSPLNSTSTADIELEIATTTDIMATTTDIIATTTETAATTTIIDISVSTTTEAETATTTADEAEEVETALPAQVEPQPSIRDLVRSSLKNVKGAYRVFIEMSGLVRKLLL